MDREKVINELNDCLENQHISFMDGVGDIYAVSEETIRNVIAMLKEKEEKYPVCEKCGKKIVRTKLNPASKKYEVIKNMNVSEKMLCQANRKDNGQLVIGYYFCMHHNDERKHIHHFIIPLEADLSIGTPIEKIQVEIDPNTVHIRCFDYLRQSKDFETQSNYEPMTL